MFLAEQILIYSLFAFALIANLIAEARDSDLGRFYTKPLLIPLILTFYLIMSRETNGFIVTGLIFCLVGDIFLLFSQNNLAFRFGAFCFMSGHFCWAAFIANTINLTIIPTQHYLWLAIPALLPSVVIIINLWKAIKGLRFVGGLYAFIGSILLYFVFLRFGYVPNYKAILSLAGTFFFLFSDYLIVYTRFKRDFKNSGVYIMLTYIIAVLLLVIGFMDPIVR